MREREFDTIIVGTGFGGLGMAIELKKKGRHDFVILEAASGVGGTWRDNVYPGAACDIESHLYSFSFEPNPSWSRTFATQPEILAYLEHVADKYGLRSHIRFDRPVDKAVYDPGRQRWTVTARGETFTARVVVAACGGLSRPMTPDLPGLERFRLKKFHSARWDKSYSLAGKTVAIIGTGASSVQITPAIAPEVKQLYVYQRTPPWVLPKPDHPYSPAANQRWAEHPRLQELARALQYLKHEAMAYGFVQRPSLLGLVSKLAKLYLEKQVKDPVLRQKLLPSYTMGCKRILPSNDYYPALCRPNVELVTDGIAEIRETSILTRDGKDRPIDALILATGFYAAESVAPFEVRGMRGRELGEAWQSGAEAYLGTTVAGFPNMFLIVGPNTGLGHSSMIFMIESQIAYISSALDTMQKLGAGSVEVEEAAQRRYNEKLHARFGKTVWSTGCVSWYRTKTGKNTTLWPGYTFEYRWRTRRFDPESYRIEPAVPRASAPGPTPSRPSSLPS